MSSSCTGYGHCRHSCPSQKPHPSPICTKPNADTVSWQLLTACQGTNHMPNFFHSLFRLWRNLIATLEQAFLHISQPSHYSIALTIVADFPHSKNQLIAENALLRQLPIFLHRQIKNPQFTQSDRLWLVLLAGRVNNWNDLLLILKPDTLLAWHR